MRRTMAKRIPPRNLADDGVHRGGVAAASRPRRARRATAGRSIGGAFGFLGVVIGVDGGGQFDQIGGVERVLVG